MRYREVGVGFVFLVLAFVFVSVDAEAAIRHLFPEVKGDVWQSHDAKIHFVRGRDKVWRSYRNRRLTKHVYHEYDRNADFVALYDVKRHLSVRLTHSAALARWSFRRKTSMWSLVHRGRWFPVDVARWRKESKAQAGQKPASLAAAPPTSKPVVATVATRPGVRGTRPATRSAKPRVRLNRPASRLSKATSRPAGRHVRALAAKAITSTKATNTTKLQKLVPRRSVLWGLQPFLQGKSRQLAERFAWLGPKDKVRYQHIAGQIWRQYRNDRPTQVRLVELRRMPAFVMLFAPERLQFVRLEEGQLWTRRKGKEWHGPSFGTWTKQRLALRISWAVKRSSLRLQELRGPLWGAFRHDLFAGRLLRVQETNPTYIALGNTQWQVRLYENRAFQRKVRKGSRWRLLGTGGWDDNPPSYQAARIIKHVRQLIQKRVKATSTRPATRKSALRPAKRPASRPVARAASRPTSRAVSKVTKRPSSRPVVRRAVGVVKRAPGKPRVRVALRLRPPRPKVAQSRPAVRQVKKAQPQSRQAPQPKPRPVASRKVARKVVPKGLRRMRIKRTDVAPWRSIAFVRVSRRGGSKAFASGVLIGANVLLTSGHVVYDRKTKKTALSLWIYPGLDNSKMKFGATYPVRWAVHPKWIQSSTDSEANNHDLALVFLKVPLGDKTGWLSYKAAPVAMTSKAPLVAVGYPLDKFFKTKKLRMWRSVRKGHATSAKKYPWKERILTSHRAVRGSNGGPLMIYQKGSWSIVGICRSGSRGKADFVRLTAAKVRWIQETIERLASPDNPANNPFGGGDDPPEELRFWEGDGIDLNKLSEQK